MAYVENNRADSETVGISWNRERDADAAAYSRDVYFGLLDPHPNELMRARSRAFLSGQLHRASQGASDLPLDMDDLLAWVHANTARVAEQYQTYLAERREGAPRRYFNSKSHALYFLKRVAPTKMVDGAWLYGVVSQWRDSRFADLIRIYLEELGDGVPDLNHVLIYKNLLATHECMGWEQLAETYFVQGAIQLALARHTSSFLPEVIGFNLGYEQLPLHLLICTHELDELGIDPYYFRLHVTIDNAASGHAARAVRAVHEAAPHLGDRRAFYRRIRNGYELNSLGAGTLDVIAEFNPETELLAILTEKAGIGAKLHSDRCRIGGKSVNEWLADPDRIPAFLDVLTQTGWIKRHRAPAESRFWQLMEGDKAPMFGVLTAYEKQVLHDWIAGDSLADSGHGCCKPVVRRRAGQPRREPGFARPRARDDFNTESRLLRDTLAALQGHGAQMDCLVEWLSPVHHSTPVGLMATRMFSERL